MYNAMACPYDNARFALADWNFIPNLHGGRGEGFYENSFIHDFMLILSFTFNFLFGTFPEKNWVV